MSFSVPDSLTCRAEETLDTGRADLSFAEPGGRRRALIEIKLHSGYGTNQIDRYLTALGTDATENALAAITRTVPTSGDDHDDPRWAGSIRWGKLLDGLRDLRPSDVELARQWLVLIDVLEAEGAMGFTRADGDLLMAWAKAAPGRSHAEEFVDSLRLPLLDVLRAALVAGALASDPMEAADSFTRGQSAQRAVFLRLGKVQAQFRVPASGPVKVKAGLWGWGDLNFAVEVAYPVGPRAGEIAAQLRDAGFRSWKDSLMERFLLLTPELLANDLLQERVLEFSAKTFQSLVASGLLDLPPIHDAPEEEEVGPAEQAL